jgi:hypothetical protein
VSFHVQHHVFLGHLAAPPAAGDGGGVQLVLLDQAPRGRAERLVAEAGSGGLGRGSGGCRRWRRRGLDGGFPVRIQLTQQFPQLNGLSGLFDDFRQRPGLYGRHLDHHLVGFQFDQHLAFLNGIARLLEPVGHGGFGDGLPHGGDADFHAHG